MSFYLKTETAASKTHGRRFSCRPENAYRRQRMQVLGRRFYSPTLGRWASRDPLEEAGGRNFYAFVNNEPIRQYDPLGLAFVTFYGNLGGSSEQEITDIEKLQSSPVQTGQGEFTGRDFKIYSSKGRCTEIRFHLKLLLNEKMSAHCVSGWTYLYKAHKIKNLGGALTADLRTEGIDASEAATDGKSYDSESKISKYATLEHERGHAQAYWEEMKPCLEQALAKYNNSPNTVPESEVTRELDGCRRTQRFVEKNVNYPNQRQRAAYKKEGLRLLWPTESELGTPLNGQRTAPLIGLVQNKPMVLIQEFYIWTEEWGR